MSDKPTIVTLTKDIIDLKKTVQELSGQVQQLQLENTKEKIPGVFTVGDRVTILSNGFIGKVGDKAVVTSVGKRIRIKVQGGQLTNRAHKNLHHDGQWRKQHSSNSAGYNHK